MIWGIFWVFLGGGLGSICRYLIAVLLQAYDLAFPLATFVANMAACLLLGIFIGLSLKEMLSAELRFFLMTGFCGGFSTFSTYSAESYQLMVDELSLWSLLNIAVSTILGIVMIYLGIKLVS